MPTMALFRDPENNRIFTKSRVIVIEYKLHVYIHSANGKLKGGVKGFNSERRKGKNI